MISRRTRRRLPSYGAITLLTAAMTLPSPPPAMAAVQPPARACSDKEYAALRQPATQQASSIDLRCSPTLDKSDVIGKRLILSGEKASGITIDCGGATFDGARGSVNFSKPTILIRSIRTKDGGWSAPHDITIRNCTVKGAIRIQGLGTNGQAEDVRLSSFQPDHTQRAQAAAPDNIDLSGISFIADGKIPLYLAPGVTHVTVENSSFTGQTGGTAIYLDAESADNAIVSNSFAVTTKSREQIALDGSARNRISGNRFLDPVNGGIYLYRNCGEGGTIRHQSPQYNEISGNTFSYSKPGAAPAVWLASRNGARLYCLTAPAAPFGSGLSSKDFAEFNTVTGNTLTGGDASLIRNDDDRNVIEGNRVE
ncbi:MULTISPECIES: NosD domain-containing protein [unclassified Rhizobium]|uniref:NosD domain-containing protein n=1 Tax=unclassified Rhizobium TaxID=2613769 RepID=UPI000B1F1D12|nr:MULTISPECIES: NosD domain-containing protein [unclassified Rhizobium]